MARTMLMDARLIDVFWVQEIHTRFHIQNIGMIMNNNDKTPYDIWKGIPTNVKHIKVLRRKCCIKREDGRIGKFDP
jgi:hypothetical protein